MRPTQLCTLLLHPNLLKASLFTPSQGIPIYFKSLFIPSSYHNCNLLVFRLALDDWPKRTIFGSLSSFIHGMCLFPLNLTFAITLESGIEPYFSYNLLFEIQSVSRVPRTIRRQFLRKTFSKSSCAFRSAHASESYFTIVVTVASNILILVCRLIFLFFQTFF